MSANQTIIFDRDLTCLKYKNDHGAPNFHAATRDLNSDLIIKVFDTDGDLQGCIPCDKALIIQHVDQIKSKFSEASGTTWSKKEENGLSVFELTTDIEPELVCDFIKTIYDGKTELNQKNGVPFYELANFLMVEKFKGPVREYVMKNVDNETLIDTWSIVEPENSFQKPCMDFVKGEEFDFEMMLEKVGELAIDKFIEFLEKVGESLTSSVLIGMRRNWLIENPGEENYERAILGADFESVTNEDKLEFYDEVMDDMDAELGKRVYRHMFPVGSILSSKVKNPIEVKEVKHDSENLCDKFVSGTCGFDDYSAWNEGYRRQFVSTNSVDTDVAEYTWKLKMDILYSGKGYYQYFGIVSENDFGFGLGYSWLYIYGLWSESHACLNNREHRNYGRLPKTGDIIEIKLNQVKHTLEFLKNGVSQGIAHENLPVQRYKLAVGFFSSQGHKNKVTIIKD